MKENKHASNRWICPNCRSANQDNFCPACGCPRPEDEEYRVCRCGYKNEKNAKFCAQCGRKMKWVAIKRMKIALFLVFAAAILLITLRTLMPF